MTSGRPNPIALISLAAASFLILSISVSLRGPVRHSVDQSTLDHEFLEAVARGNPDSVRQSLKRGAHIEAKDHNGDTALLIIAHQEQPVGDKAKDQTAIVTMVLENGANMEVRDQSGSTPLRAAVLNVDPAVIRLLLDKGANVEAKDQNGKTALMEAARLGRSDVTEVLLERTVDREAMNRALLAAIDAGPVVTHISDPQPGVKPAAAAPPSQISDLPYDTTHTIKLLLKKGADIEAKDEQGQTPLIRAAAYGQAGIARLLLDKGARIEARDPGGATALISAACGGCVIVDMGNTFDCVQLLIDRGANVGAKTKGGSTALMVAASSGQTRILKLLLAKGANVTDRDSDGSTALILAAPSGVMTATGMVFTTGSVRLLLDHHSEVNARNKKGETALMTAMSEPGATEAIRIVRLLLNHGADADIKDIHGNTALTLAKKNGYIHAIDLLQKAAGNAR
jgi:ankyrin repeat protein